MQSVAFSLVFSGLLMVSRDLPPPASAQGFDLAAYYRAMESGTKKDIDGELDLLGKLNFAGDSAYAGALLMKKAALPASPPRKLSLFNAGHRQLESAIRKDSTNAEWRFLRFMIQENAPKFLGYNLDLARDSAVIVRSYKELSSVVRKAILDYSRKSKILKPADF